MTLPDVDTIDTYGGQLQNYEPVVDPTTDRDAEAMDQGLESIAQTTHTVDRAWARVVLSASTPALAAPNGSDAGWGNTVPPTPTHVTTGQYKVTWPATIVDGLGASHALNFRKARASFEGTTAAFANASVFAANVVVINVLNAAGSPNDLAGLTLLVEVC